MGGQKLKAHQRMIHAYACATTPLTPQGLWDWEAMYVKVMGTGLFEEYRTRAACKRMITYLIAELGGEGCDYKEPAAAMQRVVPAVRAKWPAAADVELGSPALLNGRYPSTVPSALWSAWAKQLAPHFPASATGKRPTPDETLGRAWLLYWTGEQQQAAAAVLAAVVGMEEGSGGEGDGDDDDAAWTKGELAKLEAVLVTPALSHYNTMGGQDGGGEEGDMTLMMDFQPPPPLPPLAMGVAGPATSSSSLLLGTELAELFEDEEEKKVAVVDTVGGAAVNGGGNDSHKDDARVAALERELGECKALLTAQAQRMAALEAKVGSLMAWVDAYAASMGHGGFGSA